MCHCQSGLERQSWTNSLYRGVTDSVTDWHWQWLSETIWPFSTKFGCKKKSIFCFTNIIIIITGEWLEQWKVWTCEKKTLLLTHPFYVICITVFVCNYNSNTISRPQKSSLIVIQFSLDLPPQNHNLCQCVYVLVCVCVYFTTCVCMYVRVCVCVCVCWV